MLIMALFLLREKAMPRKKIPKPCGCGCGEMTKGGQFIPGHDAKLLSAIIQSVGGLENLRRIIEKHNGKDIVLVETIRERNSKTESYKRESWY